MSTPNILVVCSDQHHPRVAGFRGLPVVQTPNLDRLAAVGTHFTRTYCNSPLCTPSRMSFLTGKYTHQINSWAIGCPLDPNEMTWGRRLDQAGNASTYLGKLHFCGPYVDGGFTHHRFSREYPNTVSGAMNLPLKTPYAPRLEGHVRADKEQLLASAGSFDEPLPDGITTHPHLRKEQHFLQYGYYGHDREVTDWTKTFLQQQGTMKTGKSWTLPPDGMFWDDAVELAKKVTRTEDGKAYRGMEAYNNGHIYSLASELTLPLYDDKTGKAVVSDAWRNIFKLMMDMYSIQGNRPEKIPPGIVDETQIRRKTNS